MMMLEMMAMVIMVMEMMVAVAALMAVKVEVIFKVVVKDVCFLILKIVNQKFLIFICFSGNNENDF